MFGATGRNHGSFQVKSQIKVLNLSQTTVLTQSLCSIVHISISIFNSGRVWRVLLPFGIQPLDSSGSDSWHCSGHLFPQVLRTHLRAYIHVQPSHLFLFSSFFSLFSIKTKQAGDCGGDVWRQEPSEPVGHHGHTR